MANHNDLISPPFPSSPFDEGNSLIPFPSFDPSNFNSDSFPTALPPGESPYDPFASGRGYPEFGPSCSNVVRGFPVYNDNLPYEPLPLRCYPPPSNAAYARALNESFATPAPADTGTVDTEEQQIVADVPPPMREEQEQLVDVSPAIDVQQLRIMVRGNWFRDVVADRSENYKPESEWVGMHSSISSGWRDTSTTGTASGAGTASGVGTASGWMSTIDLRKLLKERFGERASTTSGEKTGATGNIEDTGRSGGTGQTREKEESWKYVGNTNSNDLTQGEFLARTISFQRRTLDMTAHGVSGDIYPAEEQREDFVDNINSHGVKLDYCSICKKNHIPPGPPITLAARDTCGSLIPKWFPSHLVARPWDTYRALINELVALEEKAQEENSRSQDPGKPVWDLEWHGADARWVAVGRREGWWRCRSGPDAPMVEQMCRVCHRERTPGELALTVGEDDEMRAERKKLLQDFVDEQIRLFGEMDKEVALGRIHTEAMMQTQAPGAGEPGGGIETGCATGSTSPGPGPVISPKAFI